MDALLEIFRDLTTNLSRWYSLKVESSWWPLLATGGALVLGAVAIGGLVIAFQQYRLQKKAANEEKFQDEELRLHGFLRHDFVSASKDYLVPYCSNVDPSDREDLRNTVAVRERVFDALVRELAADDRKHILILADSGMGKTTLLLNLVAREEDRFRFALISLGKSGALEQLKRVPHKRDTVLLLDAFDEDPRAIEDASGRMEQVMNSVSEFKCVVMTCRTQFFPTDEEIPRCTGIRRVAARRAGVPVVYQWLTVYLQPFDRAQIDEYVSRSIPWVRRRQRQKARRIVSDIADLAARPMLTALIPSLAASEREAHGLWDLYVFMVDTWIQRESSWIAPDFLRKSSKSLSVELFITRADRGSDRISREDLIDLLRIECSDVEAWQLTSRSLLNRDADGCFKFAHRSILEFFFVLSFIEGDRRCLSVAWTDMMCELFLSWGTSTGADTGLALRLLSEDFRETKLFPIADRSRVQTKIDADWVKSVFSSRISSGTKVKFPSCWRGAVAHVVNRDETIRAYDLAEGIVWQADVTTGIHDRAEREIYRYGRSSSAGVDGRGQEWTLLNLYELKLLCDILSDKGLLFSVIDQRELYWLGDVGDGLFTALARVRSGESGGALDYPELEFIHSGSVGSSDLYSIDVYRVPVRGRSSFGLNAMTILVHQGDAEAILAEDSNSQETSWGIRRLAINEGLRNRPTSSE
mgnify:CR=1 FL=1